MIFGRRRKKADEAEVDEVVEARVDEPAGDDAGEPDDAPTSETEAGETEAGETKAGEEPAAGRAGDPRDDAVEDESDDDVEDDESDADADADDPVSDESDDEGAEDRWAAFDASRDWRADGPFDITEVDLDDDEVQRLDFGALVVTPMPECEIRLQVTEDTQQVIAALIVQGESALELSAYAAPRTPGMWAEIRDEIITATEGAGGTADCVEGPFGTELVRNLPVQTPEGQLAFQPSRTWVAEGPRWLLRGVLFGQAALTDEHDDDLVGPFFDAFSDVVVRRGDAAKPVGDVLELTLPPELQAAAEAAEQPDAGERG